MEELRKLAQELREDGWVPFANIVDRRADELERGVKLTPVAKKYNKNMYVKPDKSKPKGSK